MGKKVSAAEFLARGRIKSSGTDKSIVNGEEVKKKGPHYFYHPPAISTTPYCGGVSGQKPRHAGVLYACPMYAVKTRFMLLLKENPKCIGAYISLSRAIPRHHFLLGQQYYQWS